MLFQKSCPLGFIVINKDDTVVDVDRGTEEAGCGWTFMKSLFFKPSDKMDVKEVIEKA